jgi:hypothetical protein
MSLYYRPDIQNGPVAKRSARSKAASLPVRSNKPPLPEGPYQWRALLGLILFGAGIATGFVFSLHQHFTANIIGREEVRLKADLDRAFSEQRDLDLRRARASSLREIERAASRQNLAPLKLDAPEVLRVLPAVLKQESLSRVEVLPASEKIISQDDRGSEQRHNQHNHHLSQDRPASGRR